MPDRFLVEIDNRAARFGVSRSQLILQAIAGKLDAWPLLYAQPRDIFSPTDKVEK